jgi:hypothetical protein
VSMIWLVLCEVLFEHEDLPSGHTKGFLRVTVWGDTKVSLTDRLAQCLESYRWRLVSIEKAGPIDENVEYPEEIADMVDRTRGNAEYIIVGRVYSYTAE